MICKCQQGNNQVDLCLQVPEGLQGGESKLAVDLLVGSPVAVGEHTALWHTVEEGPQDCIAEAIVVQRVSVSVRLHKVKI